MRAGRAVMAAAGASEAVEGWETEEVTVGPEAEVTAGQWDVAVDVMEEAQAVAVAVAGMEVAPAVAGR